MRKSGYPTLTEYILLSLLLLGVMLVCVCLGSVSLPLKSTLTVLIRALLGQSIPEGVHGSIILNVRLPRVICVALSGAALSLCGAAMQGLLRNPLADGSTLGISAGASLGAVIALAFGVTLPGIPYAGTMVMAMVFAFGSLIAILGLSYALDSSLATHSIILVGVIFSMFASALMSIVITFSGEKIRSITFWTMGSLSGSSFSYALILTIALMICGGVLLRFSRELNALALGEEQALHMGVNVRPVKMTILVSVSVLIGVCVSIGGTISFIGLVAPHMVRMLLGPDHRRLMPASLYFGAVFLLIADLIARTLLSPIELPIGVVTSLFGAVAFVVIFYRSRKRGAL